jgi:hypothetical protein
MTDSTDTQALSSAHSISPVATPLAGMLVAGYTVIYFPEDINEHSVMYGMFPTIDDAHAWANKLEGNISIHQIYSPTHNRG